MTIISYICCISVKLIYPSLTFNLFVEWVFLDTEIKLFFHYVNDGIIRQLSQKKGILIHSLLYYFVWIVRVKKNIIPE